MNRSLLLTGVLALATAAFAQSNPTERTVPPAPRRPDAPGTSINPRQNAPETPPPAGEAPASTPLRELVFAEADADKDRRVSLHEYVTFVENRMATRSVETVREETIQRFLDLDENNDAQLSEAEAAAQPRPQPAPSVPPRR